MFRISALLLALLIICLPALAESENLISQDMIKADVANYNLITAESSAYERKVSSSAEEFYPHVILLRASVSGARFGEYTVKRGDEVRKGDVLATFTLETDESALAGLELELQRAKEAMDRTIADAEKSALEMQRALINASDVYEREMIGLKIQRAEIALEKYLFEQEQTIAGLEDSIAETLAEQEGCVLVAPEDGVIYDLEFKRTGETVHNGEHLIIMYRTTRTLMRVENSDGAFRYGMDVTVEVGANKDRTQLNGRVVGCDTLISSAERSGMAYIEFDMPENIKLIRPTVQAMTMQLEGVLSIPSKAVSLSGGKHFVTRLVNGVPLKTFVNAVTSGGTKQVWVLQGLDEGDQIIID